MTMPKMNTTAKVLIVGMGAAILYLIVKLKKPKMLAAGSSSSSGTKSGGGGSVPVARTVTSSPQGNYTVLVGDGSLLNIARKFAVSLESLMMVNPELKDANIPVPPGTVLVIPGGAGKTTQSGMGNRLTSRAYALWVQAALNQIMGSRLGSTGIFDPLTTATIVRYQAMKGLRADGIVGERTEAALIADGAPSPPEV